MKLKFIFLCIAFAFNNKVNAQVYSYKDFGAEVTIKEVVGFIREDINHFYFKKDSLIIDKIETSKGFDFEKFNPIKCKVDGVKSQVNYSLYKSKGKIVKIIKTNLDSGITLDYTVFYGKGYKVFIVSRREPHLFIKKPPQDIMGFFVQFEETKRCIFVETKISFINQHLEKINVKEISSIMTVNADLKVDRILFFSDSKLACIGKVNVDANGGLYLDTRFYSDKGLYLNEDNCSQYGDLEKLKIGKLWHLVYRYEYHCNSYLKAKLTLNNDNLDIWNKGLSIK